MAKFQIITDADIVTGDPGNPNPESLVIEADRITFAGDLDKAVRRFGPDIEIRKLNGSTVVPGFNDNHIHMAISSWTAGFPNLAGLSAGEIVVRLKSVYPSPAKGQFLRGTDWDYPACPNPHKSILDKEFPDNPVLLSQYGGHGTWMNSAALKHYGVTRRSKDPVAGEILKSADGEPTGIVREYRNTKMMIEYAIRFLSRRWAYDYLENSLKLLREAGVTSVQDNTWFPPHVESIRRLYNEGRLTSRFSCWHMGEPSFIAHWMRFKRFEPPFFHRGVWKYILDGTFTTRTAWLSYEYADEPGNSGKGASGEKMFKILSSLAKHRRQGAFHAIGDRTISTFLDALARVYDRYPDAHRLRFRLEHAQLIRDEDINRLKELKVLIAAQPHAMTAEEKDKGLLGAERARCAYPFRKLLDAGIPLSFGSDFPGEKTYAPLFGIHLAVNRPEDLSITPAEALACYTSGSAFAEFAEDAKGRLKEGFLADLTLLDANPLKVDPKEIKEIKVVETIMGGRTVFQL